MVGTSFDFKAFMDSQSRFPVFTDQTVIHIMILNVSDVMRPFANFCVCVKFKPQTLYYHKKQLSEQSKGTFVLGLFQNRNNWNDQNNSSFSGLS